MIPADHWHDNGDGTAWLVTHGGLGIDLFDSFDRPCDTCGGTGRRQVDQYGNVWGDKLAEAMSTIIVGDIPCPNCIDGRHTFTIEVEVPQVLPKHWPAHLRVSVVPGMVLPIVHDPGKTDEQVIEMGFSDRTKAVLWWHDRGWSRITLPPAAQPGMWAVLVKAGA